MLPRHLGLSMREEVGAMIQTAHRAQKSVRAGVELEEHVPCDCVGRGVSGGLFRFRPTPVSRRPFPTMRQGS